MADEKKAENEAALGSDIHLVLANGKHAPAKITRVHKGKTLVDLEAAVAGQSVVITRAPLDESGTVPDSWHLPEPEIKA